MKADLCMLKQWIKKLPLIRELAAVPALKARVAYLEQRVINHRWYAIEEMLGYLVGAKLPGDYCEFGVWKGDTFGHCLRAGSVALPGMRFFAFDSFQGLPSPKNLDAQGDFTSNFHEGDFACAEESFLANIQEYHADLSRVRTVPGWFSETLTADTAARIGLAQVAAAWIDCDFYESTVPVLEFITDKLSVGTIILFDDWHVYRNLPDKGQQRACAEWLARNPSLSLAPLFSFAHYGEAFTVLSL